MAELKIGEISKPRFEFRSFGQCFCEAHKRMARLSVPVPEKVWERSSDEIYKVFGIAARSDFLNERGRKHKFQATFDWLIEPENFLKVLEGTYR